MLVLFAQTTLCVCISGGNSFLQGLECVLVVRHLTLLRMDVMCE
jgi:hypothetical protein